MCSLRHHIYDEPSLNVLNEITFSTGRGRLWKLAYPQILIQSWDHRPDHYCGQKWWELRLPDLGNPTPRLHQIPNGISSSPQRWGNLPPDSDVGPRRAGFVFFSL